MFHKNRPFLPAILFAAMIFIGSSISTKGLDSMQRINKFFDIFLSEYSLHFFGFGIFAALLAWGYHKKKSSFILIRSALLAFFFGLFIEVYQFFLPHRSFSLIDFALDGAGIVVILGVFWGIVIKQNL